MFRPFAFVLLSLTNVANAAQTITCVNTQHDFKVSAYFDNVIESKATRYNEATVKMKASFKTIHFDGPLGRVSIAPTNSPGSVLAKGRSRAGNFSFQLIVPEHRLDKTFASADMSAFFERPNADDQTEPYRIPVICRSTVR